MIFLAANYLRGPCPYYKVVENRFGKLCFRFIEPYFPALKTAFIKYSAVQKIEGIPFAFIVPYFPLFPVNPALEDYRRFKVIPTKEIFP